LTTDQRTATGDQPTTDRSFGKFQMAVSPQRIIRFTSCLVPGWVFRGVGGPNGAICMQLDPVQQTVS